MPVDPQKMTTSDVSELIDYYCIDCCHSCDECLLQDFNRELDFTIEEYNRKQQSEILRKTDVKSDGKRWVEEDCEDVQISTMTGM